MAFNDTLFQLGMDLTRSSTAQKEDHVALSHASRPARPLREPDTSEPLFVERDGIRFAGQHLIVDLFGAKKLDDLAHIERTLRRCVEVAGGKLMHMHVHPADEGGRVSAVAVLADSHIAIHSWPEARYAALDVFMRGAAKPESVIPVVRQAFGADGVVVKSHLRGEEIEQVSWQATPARKAQPARLRPVRKARAA